MRLNDRGYDAFGNQTTISRHTGAFAHMTTIAFDIRGRKTGLTDPDAGTSTYAYDALGQLVSQVDAKLQTTALEYDVLGRLKKRTESDLVSEFFYDALETTCTGVASTEHGHRS